MSRRPTTEKTAWTMKRKHIRYKAESNLMARVEWGASMKSKEFRPQFMGLVLEEGYGGAGIALNANNQIQVGDRLRVEVGKLGPLFAEVAWKNDVDHQIMKIGLKYLE